MVKEGHPWSTGARLNEAREPPRMQPRRRKATDDDGEYPLDERDQADIVSKLELSNDRSNLLFSVPSSHSKRFEYLHRHKIMAIAHTRFVKSRRERIQEFVRLLA